MRRTTCLLLLSASLVLACQRKPETAAQAPSSTSTSTAVNPQDLSKANVNTTIPVGQPDVLSQAKLGSAVGKDGNVAEEKASFKRSDPIYLTIWLKESPSGLQTSVRWLDSKGMVISEERRPMAGDKVATFKLGQKGLKVGDYRAVAYWGGNIAGEYDFTVTK
jgi:hypothetical protein